MPKLEWDQKGEHYYETGIQNGVLFPRNSGGSYGAGVAWNGLSSITENASGGEASDIYADNLRYLQTVSDEEMGITIEAYTYPPEFAECDGSVVLEEGANIGQQERKSFALSYKTIIGNDTEQNDYGYKIHIVFGIKVSPSERSYSTINDSPEALLISWEGSTTPVDVSGYRPTSHVVIDSTKVDASILASIEELLYGTEPSTDTLLDAWAETLLDSDGEALISQDFGITSQVLSPDDILALVS